MSKADLAAVKEWENEENIILSAEEEDARQVREVAYPAQVRPLDKSQDSAPPRCTFLFSPLPSFLLIKRLSAGKG